MPALLERLATGKLLWLDDYAYSQALLAGGRTPLLESGEYVAYRRKASGLLKAEVTVVPLGTAAALWAEGHPALKEAMAAKKRAVVPLRTLLGDEELRANVVETVRALRGAFPALPLVLSIPSPRAWVNLAYRIAFGADTEVGGDEADSAAVYVAEFLRSFGESGVDGVLMIEGEGADPANADEIAWYQPVTNLAQHYRWALGLQFADGSGYAGDVKGVDFTIASKALPGAVAGVVVDFGGADAPSAPAGGFRFARIPADAVPEKVLERLAALRS